MGIAPRALPQSTMSQTIIKDAVFFNLPFSTLERTVKSQTGRAVMLLVLNVHQRSEAKPYSAGPAL
jgi:hypothetical protein